ncbi:MauE/DoxX family redox-associated membrane protein [Nocardioides sp. SYSU D00065]|uniref:MauE/DoxX family redox-associated membrane protein n=1 Tax=Nocardioides sp. SYSU D00065 TaxID=2817378 RepID=UPI001B31C41C|nr:MauE/DoxX family redox-associated membrane protein [Nocardioides sp. SYSU D00065]
MSSPPLAALVVQLTLAGVLLVSGVAKLRDPRATRDAFDALRVPGVLPADRAATALPWVEVTLAVLLLAAPRGWLVPVAVAVLALMLAYTWLVGRALGFDEPVSCSCFGSLGRHDVDRTTVARNVLLSVLAGAAVWYAVEGGSAPAALRALDRDGWWGLAATGAATAVVALVAGRASTPPASSEVLDYERQPIPFGVLTRHDGSSATLTELAASQARLLLVLNPGCSPCVRVAERVDGWSAQLGPAVGVVAVYPDGPSARAASQHAAETAAWEPELNIRRVFSVGTPAAILLGADGFLAGGPVAGEDDVVEFVAEVQEALAEEPIGAE